MQTDSGRNNRVISWEREDLFLLFPYRKCEKCWEGTGKEPEDRMKNMHGKNFRKAAAVMGLIGLLTCLSGCGKIPDKMDGNLASGH